MTDIEPTTRPSAAVRADARRRLAPVTFAQQLALIANRCGGEIARLPGGIIALKGSLGEVTQMAHAITETGQRVVHSSMPQPTGRPDQFLLNVRLAPRAQALVVRQEPPRRQLSRRALWLIAGGGVAVLAGLGWAAYLAVTAIAANLPAVLVVAGIVVAALVLVGKSAGGGGTSFSGTFQGKID